MPKRKRIFTLANPEGSTDGTTEQRRLFIQEYIKLRCVNGAEAARRAGVHPNNARQQAYHWLKLPDVQRELERYRKEVDQLTIVRAADAIEELLIVARSTIQDVAFVDDGGKLVLREDIDDDSELWRAVRRITSKTSTKETEHGTDESTEVTIEMHDKGKALHMMMTHLGILVKKLEVSGKMALADAIKGFLAEVDGGPRG